MPKRFENYRKFFVESSRLSVKSLSLPINRRIVGWKNLGILEVEIPGKTAEYSSFSPLLVHLAKSVRDGPTIAASALVLENRETIGNATFGKTRSGRASI